MAPGLMGGTAMVGIGITRTDLTASDLRHAACGEKNARTARRMQAVAQVLDGFYRGTAARSGGMDRQTLRDWVLRYNAEGLAGLSGRKHSGRPPATARHPPSQGNRPRGKPQADRHSGGSPERLACEERPFLAGTTGQMTTVYILQYTVNGTGLLHG